MMGCIEDAGKLYVKAHAIFCGIFAGFRATWTTHSPPIKSGGCSDMQ
jgi:hypothetical protein